jgi:hypothetical protein
VLILRLDCPEGYQQYWALIPPESGLISEEKTNHTTSTSTSTSSATSSASATASAMMEHKHSRGGSGGSYCGGGDVGSFSNLESGPSLGPGSWDVTESALHMVRMEVLCDEEW